MSEDERNQNASTSSAPSPHGFQVTLVSSILCVS